MTNRDPEYWDDLSAAGLVRRGRLFKLVLKRSFAARTEALASIRQVPPLGHWQARLGGKVRGRTVTFLSRAAAEQAVNQHYNERLAGRVASSCKEDGP